MVSKDRQSMTKFAKMLQGIAKGTPGTGQKDDVPAMIDGQEPAALSEGEYVIPADVVAIIGDGNNEAGAKILDDMVAQIRQGHKGSPDQPKPFAGALRSP